MQASQRHWRHELDVAYVLARGSKKVTRVKETSVCIDKVILQHHIAPKRYKVDTILSNWAVKTNWLTISKDRRRGNACSLKTYPRNLVIAPYMV